MRAKVLVSGAGVTEGPVQRAGGDIAFVSGDRGEVHVTTLGGASTRLAVTGGGPNGLVEGADGLIYVAQNGGVHPARKWPGVSGGVQVIGPDGQVDWVSRDPISPNDICFGPDGLLYVTDPTRNRRYDDGRIWRIDPVTGGSELLASVPWYPNGIGFAAAADMLYVASTAEKRIVRFDVTPSGLGRPETAVQLTSGLPDGFAFDDESNILICALGEPTDGGPMRIDPATAGPGSIQTWSLEGEFLDRFEPGTSAFYTNLALDSQRRLVITDTGNGSVLMVDDWPTAGLLLPQFRDSATP